MSVRDELGNVCNHQVRLHFRSIGIPRVPEMTALRNAQRVYGRYAIAISFANGESLGLSETEWLTLNVLDGQCKWDAVSDEQNVLYGMGDVQTVTPTDVLVYYVNGIREPDGNTLAGCAGHAPGRPCVAVSAVGSQWTLAHELAHVLLGSSFTPVHATQSTNLMYSPTAGITANPPGLTDAQLTAIRASRYCVRC